MEHHWIIRNTLKLYCAGTLGQYAGRMACSSLEKCSSYKKKVSAFLQLGWHIPTVMGAWMARAVHRFANVLLFPSSSTSSAT